VTKKRDLRTPLAISAFLIIIAAPSSAATIYVDTNAPGPTHDGSSWTNAFTELQSGLDVAMAGDEIWVAAGTYTPTAEVGGYITFQMVYNVAIYGGLSGVSENS